MERINQMPEENNQNLRLVRFSYSTPVSKRRIELHINAVETALKLHLDEVREVIESYQCKCGRGIA